MHLLLFIVSPCILHPTHNLPTLPIYIYICNDSTVQPILHFIACLFFWPSSLTHVDQIDSDAVVSGNYLKLPLVPGSVTSGVNIAVVTEPETMTSSMF